MRICDLTMAYNASSGGIRTYIDQKRRYLLEHTEHEHALIIPGEDHASQHDGRAQTHWIKSPSSGYGDYRLMWRPKAIAAALDAVQPDVIELGTFFVCPWPAFYHRKQRRRDGQRCAVAGFFHTDIAKAYVHAPLHETLGRGFTDFDPVADAGEQLAELLGHGAEHYFGKVFGKCDLMLASSPHQADRLKDYGIDRARCVPMGVDVETFHPGQRSEDCRASIDADEQTCVMIYVGRLAEEKRVKTVVAAYEQVKKETDARLVLIGEGPMYETFAKKAEHDEGLTLRGYVSDKQELARWLASADVYVTAGPHETFGISVIEAQACGLPVVGVDAGALVERVVPGAGLLGPVDDAQAMVRNTLRAWREREAMGGRARQHVEQNFTWPAAFESLLEGYQEAVEGGAG